MLVERSRAREVCCFGLVCFYLGDLFFSHAMRYTLSASPLTEGIDITSLHLSGRNSRCCLLLGEMINFYRDLRYAKLSSNYRSQDNLSLQSWHPDHLPQRRYTPGCEVDCPQCSKSDQKSRRLLNPSMEECGCHQ